MKNILAENMIRFGTKNLHVDAFLLQENISTDMLNTIKKAPSLKKLGMIDATAGTEIAYGSTKAPLTIFIDPSKHEDDDVYWDIKTALNKLMLGTQFNVITGPMVIIGYNTETGAIHYAPDIKSSSSPNQNQQKYNNKGLAQKAYDQLYDLTSKFGGDYPLTYLDDNLPQELNHTLDKFFDDNDYLTPEEDKQLAKEFLVIVKELKDELKYG
jgi:hypothetical protein